MSKRSRFFLDLKAVTWNTILWEKIEIYVFKLQTRIYKASLKNQYGKMKWLQKKLLQCLQAKVFTLKNILSLKAQETFFSHQQKLILVKYLSIQSITKIFVQKVLVNFPINSKKIKFLQTLSFSKKIIQNFFIVQNEARNFLFKLALEAEWESKFSSYSFGFRPGRSSQDLVQLIYFFLKKNSCNSSLNFILGKLKKSPFFFNFFSCKNVNQQKLKFFFAKLHTFPKLQKCLEFSFRTCFCSFFFYNTLNFSNICKISFQQFLFNIILQGLDFFLISKIQVILLIYGTSSISFFSDTLDFQTYRKLILGYFDIYGFIFINFDVFNNFYNFNFLNYTFLKFNFFKNKNYSFLYKTKKRKKILVFPSKESQKFFLQSIRCFVNFFKGKEGTNFLIKIVSKIKNWSFFFRSVDSKKVFSKLDHCLYCQFRSWCLKRHPKWNFYKILLKYFPKKQNYFFEGKFYQNNWVFFFNSIKSKVNFFYVPKFTWILKNKYQKIFATRSPFDGDCFYWIERFFRLKTILL